MFYFAPQVLSKSLKINHRLRTGKFISKESKKEKMSGLAFTGHAHHCLPFWKRVVSCHNNSIIPKTECALQREDFLECRHGYKQVSEKIE